LLLDLLLESLVILALGFLVSRMSNLPSASNRSRLWQTVFTLLLFLPMLHFLLPQLTLSINNVGVTEVDLNSHPLLLQILNNFGQLAIAYALGSLALIIQLVVGVARVLWFAMQSSPLRATTANAVLKELVISNGTTERVQLRLHRELNTPITCGVMNHVIILPAAAQSWPRHLLKQVLSHELGHIARKDWLHILAARIVSSIYWINPLVWLAQKELLLESEKSCDDMAIDDTGSSISYAENLLWLASTLRGNRNCHAAKFLSSGSELSQRIQHILLDDHRYHYIERNGNAPGIVIALFTAALISSLSVRFVVPEIPQLEPTFIPVTFYANTTAESRQFREELESLQD